MYLIVFAIITAAGYQQQTMPAPGAAAVQLKNCVTFAQNISTLMVQTIPEAIEVRWQCVRKS